MLDIKNKVRGMSDTISAVNVPMENRIYLNEWQVKKLREEKVDVKIYTGPKGGQFLDNRELKEKGIDLDKIFKSDKKHEQNDKNNELLEIMNLIQSDDIIEVKSKLDEMFDNRKISGANYNKILCTLIKENDKYANIISYKDIAKGIQYELLSNDNKFNRFNDIQNDITDIAKWELNSHYDSFSYSGQISKVEVEHFASAYVNKIYSLLVGASYLDKFYTASYLDKFDVDQIPKYRNELNNDYGIDLDSIFDLMFDLENSKKIQKLYNDKVVDISFVGRVAIYDMNSSDKLILRELGRYNKEYCERNISKAMLIKYLQGQDDVADIIYSLYDFDNRDEVIEQYEYLKNNVFDNSNITKEFAQNLEIKQSVIDDFKEYRFRRGIGSIFEYTEQCSEFVEFDECDYDNVIIDWLGRLYNYFKNKGYNEQEAMCLAKGTEILRFWTMDNFEEYSGYIEEYIHNLYGNHRSKRKKHELNYEPDKYNEFYINNYLINHLCKECENEFLAAIRLSQEIFESRYGDSLTVYRGISGYESLQIINDLLNHEYLTMDMTMSSSAIELSAAESFNKTGLVVEMDIDKEQVIGGWWAASPDYLSESEINLQYKSGGQPVKIIDSKFTDNEDRSKFENIMNICSDDYWRKSITREDLMDRLEDLESFLKSIILYSIDSSAYMLNRESRNELRNYANGIFNALLNKVDKMKVSSELKNEADRAYVEDILDDIIDEFSAYDRYISEEVLNNFKNKFLNKFKGD